jgi:membrane protease YdiL (CAAX protease family)
MEGKPDPEQDEIGVTSFVTGLPNSRRFWLLAFFMTLWPWFWVSLGLYQIRDFRVTMLLYELLCCLLPVLIFRSKRVRLLPLGLPVMGLAFLIILANLVLLGAFKATHGMMLDWPALSAHFKTIHLVRNWQFWLYGFYLITLNPWFEELFWRGTVYREWRQVLSPWQANLLSSVFFGLWHWLIVQFFCPPVWAIIATFVVMFGGMMFAWTYERTNTLGAGILMHGLGADLPLVAIVHTALVLSHPAMV